ncbi:MAG TPA: secondary thiamine-phosphate synthase enzyme YjbQ [bacterium]|nr:secondary thiamine-phosphate synthase enzyme YjbQ [bacterium]
MEIIKISTKKAAELIEITTAVQSAVDKTAVKNGLAFVFSPHTTAGITINEHADPSVGRDIRKALDKIVPLSDGYEHAEGNSAAHIKASMAGPSQVIMVVNGTLRLGTWQGVFFCEFDGPRNREVWVKVTEG